MANEQREVIIIGSGPSGYTAAIYLGRARLKPLLFSGLEIGGQLMYTTDVENFPGFAQGVEGPNLMMAMREQAERFETEIIDAKVESVSGSAETGFTVVSEGQEYHAKSLLIATGAKSRMLGLPEEAAVLGRGLSTCAVCDAAFFRDQVAYVVGGGDTAMEDTLALTKFAKEVYVIHRRDSFRASQIMQERVLNNPKVKVIWNSTVKQIKSTDGAVSGIILENLQTKATEERPTNGLFYAIGHVPSTEFLGDFVERNPEGYITTNLVFDKQSHELAGKNFGNQNTLQFLTQTSKPGVFAAGDCVDFRYRQAVTAAAFGTMAALDVERWLELG
jgi:thioredoxin reductase (NADPH)